MFTDQLPHKASEWANKNLRCYLCGYRFKDDDLFRWIFMGDLKLVNIIVCKDCDDTKENLAEKWRQMQFEAENKYWYFTQRRM